MNLPMQTILSVASGLVISLIVLVGAGLLAWFIWREKRYDTSTFVLDVDFETGQINGLKPFGRGGVFVDGKTKNKRFFLKGDTVGLDPDKVPYVNLLGGNNPLKPNKGVILVQTGLKNFRFIRPTVNANKTLLFKVGEEDVNWAINAYERQKKVFGTSLFEKVLPYIPLVICTFGLVIIIVTVFKNLPEVKELLIEMKHITENLKVAKMGTVIA